jgi:hypothetical protein
MTTLLTINTLLFAVLFVVWKRGDLLNLILKFIFFAATIGNGIYLFQVVGYVVKK